MLFHHNPTDSHRDFSPDSQREKLWIRQRNLTPLLMRCFCVGLSLCLCVSILGTLNQYMAFIWSWVFCGDAFLSLTMYCQSICLITTWNKSSNVWTSSMDGQHILPAFSNSQFMYRIKLHLGKGSLALYSLVHLYLFVCYSMDPYFSL